MDGKHRIAALGVYLLLCGSTMLSCADDRGELSTDSGVADAAGEDAGPSPDASLEVDAAPEVEEGPRLVLSWGLFVSGHFGSASQTAVGQFFSAAPGTCRYAPLGLPPFSNDGGPGPLQLEGSDGEASCPWNGASEFRTYYCDRAPRDGALTVEAIYENVSYTADLGEFPDGLPVLSEDERESLQAPAPYLAWEPGELGDAWDYVGTVAFVYDAQSFLLGTLSCLSEKADGRLELDLSLVPDEGEAYLLNGYSVDAREIELAPNGTVSVGFLATIVAREYRL